jgi:ankyrin repeat protein
VKGRRWLRWPSPSVLQTTPLSLAAQYGHVEIVQRLLEAKASLKKVDHASRNPLVWRC